MLIRLGKYIAIGSLASILSFAAYLAAPHPFLPHPQLEAFPREEPVVIDPAKLCKRETVYVTEKQVGHSDNEVIDGRCSSLQSELVDAAKDGDLERIRQVVRKGANVSSPGLPTLGGNGLAPAWSGAIWSRQTEALKLLLDNGVDVNETERCCMTHDSMLMMAIKAKDRATIRLLLSRGADPGFIGDYGWSVIDLAESSEDSDVRSLVFSACNADALCRARTRVRKLSNLLGVTERL